MPLQVVKIGEQVAISKIAETAQKVRKETTDIGIQDLLHSIQKHGQIHPISLLEEAKGSYTCIQGHRRLTAARIGKLPSLRANIYRIPPGEGANRERLVQEHLYAANMAEPLLPVERARMFDMLMRDLDFNEEQVAECFEGETAATVNEALKFLNIDETVLDIVQANPGKFTATHLKVLAEYASPGTKHAWRMKPDEQRQVARELVDQVDKQVSADPRKFEARVRSVVKARREQEQQSNVSRRKALTDPVKSLFKAIETVENATKGLSDLDLNALKEIDPGEKGVAIKKLYDVIEAITNFTDSRIGTLPVRKAIAS